MLYGMYKPYGDCGPVDSLCIAAHQDDIEIMAYGPIAACYETKSFAGIVLTDGAGSPRTGKFSDCTNEEMKGIRVKEQRKAAEIGHYSSITQCGFSSAEVKDPENTAVKETIIRLLLELRPKKVYLHNLFDKHDTHVASSFRAIEALREIQDSYRAEEVVFLEVWRSLDWLPDSEKVLMNTAPYPEVASAILNVYVSQIEGGKAYEKAALGRRFSNATFFESHETDAYTSLSFGLRATDFVYSALSYTDFTDYYLEKFRLDVSERLQRLTERK